MRVQARRGREERLGTRGPLGTLSDPRYPGPFNLAGLGDAFTAEDMAPRSGWKFRMAMGQNPEDRGDGASEPFDSNSIHGAAQRRAVAPGEKRTRIKRKLPFIYTVGAVYRGCRSESSAASLFLKRIITAGLYSTELSSDT